MKKVLMYLLLFLAVIGLIFGLFYLIIALKTPTAEELMDDMIDEMDEEEVVEEVKMNRNEADNATSEPDWLVYEGEGFSFEYPEDYDLDQLEIYTDPTFSGSRDDFILFAYGINIFDTEDETNILIEDKQIGTLDYYRVQEDNEIAYYTVTNDKVVGFRLLSNDLDNETLIEILETINFD